MLAALLDRIGQPQQLILRHARRGQQVRDLRLALRDGAGLIQRDDLDAPGRFQRSGRFEQDAMLCANAVADHDGHRRGKAEGARAADDEHGNGARQRIAHGLADKHPDNKRDKRNADDGRDEHTGDAVGHLRNGGLCCGCVADHSDDLRERRILADARGAAAQEAGLVQRGSRDGVARSLIHRDALAGQRGLVHGAAALLDDTVHRDGLAGADDKNVAGAHLLDGDERLLTGTDDSRRLRGELHEALEGVCRLAL